MAEPSPLVAFIREKIRRHGPIPFPWFMEQALYHPEFGYYSSMRCRIGLEGRLLHERQRQPPVRSAAIPSAHRNVEAPWYAQGFFDRRGRSGGWPTSAGYTFGRSTRTPKKPLRAFVTRSLNRYSVKQQQQRQRLEPQFPGKVKWLTGLADTAPIVGAFISNELVDAMPVHIVEYESGRWSELLVDHSRDNFLFVPSRVNSTELAQALEKLPLPSRSPYRTEVNLAASRWIQAVGAKLRIGFVLIVDYGYSRDEYYSPERTEGTLSCYSRHRRTFNPFERPGEIDITSHVDFTSLVEAAGQENLHLAGYTDQHHFMVGAAEPRLRALERAVEEQGGLTRAHSTFLGAYRTLMHPGNMGMAFKFLLLTKGLSEQARLSGFRYAPDPRKSLACMPHKC